MISNFLRYMTFKQDDPLIIFDIGSRDCEQSIEFYKAFSNSKIYAFECNPNTLPLCEKNITKYSDRIALVPKAVNSFSGTCTFFPINQKETVTTWKDGNPGASSLFKSNGQYTVEKYVQDETAVPCITLSDFMVESNINKVDIIWMDLQGAELLALKSMGEFLKKTRYIHTEVSYRPMYDGQVLFNELHSFMTDMGFVALTPFHINQCWQEDVVYLNVGLL
jgi:FkbM family methyltransferase